MTKPLQTVTIHKATLAPAPVQTLELPAGALIRALQAQHGVITLWYECQPKAPVEARHFVIAGTGWPLPDVSRLNYLGTVQIEPYVWHVYEALS